MVDQHGLLVCRERATDLLPCRVHSADLPCHVQSADRRFIPVRLVRSVQGPAWAQATADHGSDVGKWFSWGVSASDKCWGYNPDGAQGSWGSSGSFSGVESGLASWGSESYATYLSDALANSWTRNLGIDAYCVDCIGCYDVGYDSSNCPNGMLQTGGNAKAAWASIVKRVRQQQPQVVTSGEAYGSWMDVMQADSDVGGQGFESYHTTMQQAVFNGDASGVEGVASTSGADAASVLCYLNPHYDGTQPGACPTMYFRDNTETITDVKQHRLWVGLEAGSGIVSQVLASTLTLALTLSLSLLQCARGEL
jgi:hypothetical protein